jgi:rubredoxin---NAD+ reductase
VTGIDVAAKAVTTDKGSFAYAKLILAVGADPVRLPLEGHGADQVLSVNHVDDYAQLRARLERVDGPAHVVILGAGLIGCEFADDLMAGGHTVTLVDPNAQPLAALASPALGAGLARAWSAHPAVLRLGTSATRVDHTLKGLRVTLRDGGMLDADIVLSAVGLRPSIALAQAAQLETRRGIVVDAFGRTSAKDIYALGDCAEYTTTSGNAVLPYVAPLIAAARAIASTLAGTPVAIDLKRDAIIVKTPSYRLALAPPPSGSDGTWVNQEDGERTIARFIDANGVLRGFGLSLHTPALRQSLLAELSA